MLRLQRSASALRCLCSCVDRPKLGDVAIGNHLALRLDFDWPYLAEVRVADALIGQREAGVLPLLPIDRNGSLSFSIFLKPSYRSVRLLDHRQRHRTNAIPNLRRVVCVS